MVGLSASEIPHAFEVISRVLFPHGGALSPGCFGLIGDTAIVALFLILFLQLSIYHGVFILLAFLDEMFLELGEVAHPF